MKALITDAIKKFRRLNIYYEPGHRTIEPHAFGKSSEGHLILRAYQTEGASASGEHAHWKLFRVDRMRSLNATDEAFHRPRSGYKKGDRAMKGGIIEEL